MSWYHKTLTRLDPLPAIAWYDGPNGLRQCIAVSHTATDVLVWERRRGYTLAGTRQLYTRHLIVHNP
jgi:hypothetical protein